MDLLTLTLSWQWILLVFLQGGYLLHPSRAYNPSARFIKDQSPPISSDYFLSQVEETVQNVLNYHGSNNILDLPNIDRESVGVARNLDRRLKSLRRNNDCPRCWMQRAHCICHKCKPVSDDLPGLNRIFLLMHHKEIGMKVDTAKLIMAAFPEKCRLVVSGIGPDHQKSMSEFMQAVENNSNCLILFPDETAQGLNDVIKSADDTTKNLLDLVVIDGTWIQARKMHTRYIKPTEDGGPIRVKLSQKAVTALEQPQDNSAHQMRRHSITWRQVGTFEATRLFLKDLNGLFPSTSSIPACEQIRHYQDIANEAAKVELGPLRQSTS